jgi:hypothetical protein
MASVNCIVGKLRPAVARTCMHSRLVNCRGQFTNVESRRKPPLVLVRSRTVSGTGRSQEDRSQTQWKEQGAWITLCSIVFIYMAGVSMLSPILPSILLHFGASSQAVGIILSSSSLAMCATTLYHLYRYTIICTYLSTQFCQYGRICLA